MITLISKSTLEKFNLPRTNSTRSTAKLQDIGYTSSRKHPTDMGGPGRSRPRVQRQNVPGCSGSDYLLKKFGATETTGLFFLLFTKRPPLSTLGKIKAIPKFKEWAGSETMEGLRISTDYGVTAFKKVTQAESRVQTVIIINHYYCSMKSMVPKKGVSSKRLSRGLGSCSLALSPM